MTSKKKIAIIVSSLSALVLLGAIFLLELNFSKKFSGNTYISDVDVSYTLAPEAKSLLTTETNEFLKTTISFEVDGKVLKIKPSELGLSFQVNQTVDTLLQADNSQKSLGEFLGFRSNNERRHFLLSQIDSGKLFNVIDQKFNLKELEPKSASLYFDEKKQLTVKDATPGILIDKKKLLADFKTSSENLNSGKIVIGSKKAEPEITKAVLELEKERIKDLLNQKIILEDPVYTGDYTIKLNEHLDWLTFVAKEEINLPIFSGQAEEVKGKNLITIEVDRVKFNEYIDANISKWLDKPADPVNIYTDKDGKVVIEGKGVNGLKIQRDNLKKALELAIINKIGKVIIPVAELAAEVKISEDLQAQGIKEQVSVGHTSYYGSPANRLYNVKLGASKMNGVLIKPDETFVFNQTLGPVDGSNGYKKELVIKSIGTIPEYGGGICQVSTTVYRAALFAGLPIVERNQHSYAVSYYSQIMGDGLDATIYIGGANLKFKNDTGHSLLMQSYVDKDYELYIVLYGTKDGRSVEMEGPYISNRRGPPATIYTDSPNLTVGQTKMTDKAHAGFSVLWYRHLTDAVGKITTEEIHTNYRAMPAKVSVGTGL
ncbi:MAG: VanW family protein [Patescibacteria group bacterium]